MKKIILTVGAFFFAASTFSQTQLFFEDFESGGSSFDLNTSVLGGEVGTAGDNMWVINNVYTGGSGMTVTCFAGSNFTVGNTDAQPTGISSTGGNYLHILSDEAAANNIDNSNYSPADAVTCFFPENYSAVMNTDVSTVGMVNTTLNFWWLNQGSQDGVGEVYYSLDQGMTWTQLTQPMQDYWNQSTWTQQSVHIPQWDDQPNLRFAFVFANNQDTGLAGTDPAFSLDDVEVTAEVCNTTTSSVTLDACETYTVPSGHETYTTSGVYEDTIQNVQGCDSIITIDLTIIDIDTTVTENAPNLVSNHPGASYQWLIGCDTMPTVISGETSQSIDITSYSNPGYYSVEITANGCVDTSTCIYADFFGLTEWASNFKLVPNPTNGNFQINFNDFNEIIDLKIIDLEGREVYNENNFMASGTRNFNIDVPSGMYIIQMTNSEGISNYFKLRVE